MGRLIDLGEPDDKRWREDLEKLLRHPLIKRVRVLEEKAGRVTALDYSSPWEAFDLIKEAIYAIQPARRINSVHIAHAAWFNERYKEINHIRKSCYYCNMLHILAKKIKEEGKIG